MQYLSKNAHILMYKLIIDLKLLLLLYFFYYKTSYLQLIKQCSFNPKLIVKFVCKTYLCYFLYT